MNQPSLNKSVEVKDIVNVYFKNQNIQFKLYIKRNCASLIPTQENVKYNESSILTKLRNNREFKELSFWIDDKFLEGDCENKMEIPCINFAEKAK